jgi:hypothetical protein
VTADQPIRPARTRTGLRLRCLPKRQSPCASRLNSALAEVAERRDVANLDRRQCPTARTAVGLPRDRQPQLTPFGDVVQILVRILAPVLLGLAVLSIRGRVKR